MTTTPPPASTPNETNFFTQFLQKLNIPVTPGALAALFSVSHYEGLNDYNNPLNAIQVEPGSTNFNSVGVQRYASFDSGVAGESTLFQGSHWDAVRSALATGNEQTALQAFDAAYTWSPGTNIPALSGSALTTVATHNVGAAGEPATLTGSNPLNPGSIASGIGGAITDPVGAAANAVGAGAGAVSSAVTGAVSSAFKSALPFFENVAAVILGVALVFVGLVLFAQASGVAGHVENGAKSAGPLAAVALA